MSAATIRSITRAAIACGAAAYDGEPVEDVLHKRVWHNDRVTRLVTRTASAPAMTSVGGWAAELGHVSQAFLRTLTPMSAAAQLLDACLTLSFDGAASISLPAIAPGTAEWVGEGAPIRVKKRPTTAQTLHPSKLASITAFSREMMDSSNIESIVTQAMIDSTAASLDGYLFDNIAATIGTRPAGILNGVTPLVASTDTDKLNAMGDDISKLVGAIAAFAGNSSIAIVASPTQATRLLMFAVQQPGIILMSNALPAGSVIALATNSLVAAVEPIVIDASKNTVLHYEDTSPQPPPASPEGSIWQTDCVALRMRLPITWAIRDARAVALVSSVSW